MIRLKPCPHIDIIILIVCKKCATTIADDENLSIHEVETRWNTRTDTLSSPINLGIPCDKCGGTNGWICECNLMETLEHYKEAINAQAQSQK